MANIVIALGGNALGITAKEQIQKTKVAAKSIVDLVEEGHNISIVHGNGPQVGIINSAFENFLHEDDTMPFSECTAMSQGYIGYHLQQAIDSELFIRNIKNIPVVSLVTQIIVDPKDSAFQNPTKPIGKYYSEKDAKSIMKKTKYVFKEDAGRGWRRVVPSPKPLDIYEKDSIKTLINNNNIIITCGGGGIPIIKNQRFYEGIDAVIDKDFAAEKLAEFIEADMFVILTAVDNVFINFGQPNQKALYQVSTYEIESYIKEKQFSEGSMLPKVEAALNFAKSKPDRFSLIASLDNASLAIQGKSGTRISL